VYRILPNSVGIDKVAAKLKELNVHGLLLVGGFEVCLLCYIYVTYAIFSYEYYRYFIVQNNIV